MNKSVVTSIIFAVIIVSPGLFHLGFAVHDALEDTITCQEACKKSNYSYIACDENVCFCEPEADASPIHIKEYQSGNVVYTIECGDD